MIALEEEIIDIKFNKKYVILFLKNDKLSISKDTYLNNYFYIGKKISTKDIIALKKKEEEINITNYLNNIVSKYNYCEKIIKQKLKIKYNLDDKKIDELLKPYIDNNLISNKNYSFNLIDSLYINNYSKEYINNQLKKYEIEIDDEIYNYIQEICIYNKGYYINIIKKLDLKFKNYLVNKRKNKIINYFYRHGFEKENYLVYLNDFYSNFKDDKLALKNLEKDYLKLSQSNNIKNVNEYEKKKKIISKLLLKGYQYDDIITYLENK